ncbi:helix-turn-helix domain-containing protein [Erwinia sp. JUb26]|uniref:helix-turn-helix domain-containing protein n=1 Tax=Erwinia sp. JUb26 TaxID=2485126 RepID=UPI000F47380C|nr:helix-turn-helix transcriptional regulator [Erwinia sp. JUb26]ROR09964.1 helix-turn-helix protein [Erwinia sp. JUb26]
MSLKLYSESTLIAQLGQRLREHRLRRNLLQKELAAKAGISVSALKKLESDGRVTLENFMKVVFALRLEREMTGLFELPAMSIAQVEALKAPTRQRAAKRRTPTAVQGSGTKEGKQ